MHCSFTRLRYLGASLVTGTLVVACGHVDHRPSSGGSGSNGGESDGGSSAGGAGISGGHGALGGSSTGSSSNGGSSNGGMASAAGSAGALSATGGRTGSGGSGGASCSLPGLFKSCFYVADFDDPEHVPHYALGGAAGAGSEPGGTELCPAPEALNWAPGERDLCHISFAGGPACPNADGTICCYEVHYSCE